MINVNTINTLLYDILGSIKHEMLKKMFLSGTNRFFKQLATKMGIETSFVDCTVIDNIKKAMKPNTKVFECNNYMYWQSLMLQKDSVIICRNISVKRLLAIVCYNYIPMHLVNVKSCLCFPGNTSFCLIGSVYVVN